MTDRLTKVLFSSLALRTSAVLISGFGCIGTSGDDLPSGDGFAPGTVRTLAGTGQAGFDGDGGRAERARLNRPMDMALTSDGALLIADFGNHRVRRVDGVTGIVTTVAGTGRPTGDAALASPAGVTPWDGGFLVAAWGDHRVFDYATDQARTLVGGNGVGACAPHEPATAPMETSFRLPRGVAVMADGSWLVSEQGCHRIRRLRDGGMETFAGTGEAGYFGDGGPAAAAAIRAGEVADGPSLGMALSPEDPPDELFIADTGNHVIRQVKLFTGRMETLAGTGEPGFVDGPPTIAQFNRPTHVFSGRDHSLWIVDTGNHAIRYLDALNTRVETVVGTGTAGFNGDGRPPTETQLDSPSSVWVADDGTVYVADAGNHRIRVFVPTTFAEKGASNQGERR